MGSNIQSPTNCYVDVGIVFLAGRTYTYTGIATDRDSLIFSGKSHHVLITNTKMGIFIHVK